MEIENRTPADYTGEQEPRGYHEATTVNGVDISVGWDNGYNDYTIYFPQIDLSHAWENEEGVSDQVLRLSRRPDVAKKVFDYAVQLAQTESNVYEIYRKVDAFSRDLPYDKDEPEEATPTPPPEAKQERGPDKSYHEATTVNGVEISVGWDNGYDDYTIYFSQIQLGEESSKKGVYDQVIRLTRRPEVAKQVFDYAVARAQLTSDLHEIFKKVEEYSRDLPYDEE